MQPTNRYVLFGILSTLFLLLIGTQSWLSIKSIQKQRIADLNDVNHTVAVSGAAQLGTTLLDFSNAARNHVSLVLMANQVTSGAKPVAHPLSELRLVGLQLFRKDAAGYVEERLPLEDPTIGFTAETVASYLGEAEKNGRCFWQAEKNGQAPRLFTAVRTDFQGSQPIVYVAVAELESLPLAERVQAANVFDSYLVNGEGRVLFHAGTSGPMPTSNIQLAAIKAAMQSRGLASKGTTDFGAEGQTWVGSVAPVGNTGFFYLSQVNSADVPSSVMAIVQMTAVIGLLGVLLTFFVSSWASAWYSRQIWEDGSAAVLGGEVLETLESKPETRKTTRMPSPAAPLTPMAEVEAEEEIEEVTNTGTYFAGDAKPAPENHEEVKAEHNPAALVDEDEDLRRIE